MAERVSFVTMDGVTVVGEWMTAPTTIGAVVLLHALPQDRGSWAAFQAVLAKYGLASLAIDLRGHGESIRMSDESVINYKDFGEGEHQSSIYDVIAAVEWIGRRGIERSRIGVGGASFGANLAVQMLAEEPAMRAAILLSPGRNYHGTNIVEDIPSALPHQSIWMAASEGDDQEAYESALAAFEESSADRKQMVPLKNAGHGTAIFSGRPDLMDQAAEWLKQSAQGL
jgi:pimeloyl-ACP methyl ester carboxylesterase